MNKGSDKVFFPGLNGLRFFAALAVVITHIELLSASFGYDHLWDNPIIYNLGGLGVYFFFVLSGFLITFLLLKEKQTFNTISTRKFYVRRILRIWPLYYLIVLIGFFILPQFNEIDISYLTKTFDNNYGNILLMYLFIMPNLAYSMYNAVPHIGQLWSIGVEEQFYLFWPLIVKYSGKIIRSILLVIILLIAVKTLILFAPSSITVQPYYKPLKMFFAMSKIECMAIGALGAYYLFNNSIPKLLYNKLIQLLLYITLPLLIFFTPDFLQDGVHIAYSVLFLGIILNVSSNEGSIIKLNNKSFDFLGDISYGMYMYHMMLIPLCIKLISFVYPENDITFKLLTYISSLLATIMVSFISYKYFERYFIKLKGKFAKVTSGSS